MNLLALALADLPEVDSVLGCDSPTWDERLGGKLGPGRWRYFEDGPANDPRRWGTTCEVYLVALASLAGWPPRAINREPPEGRGFTPGMHLPILEQNLPHGWKLPPGLPAPGDAYVIEHANKGVHVGVVLAVERLAEGGAWYVTTGDGGQTDARPGWEGRQCATRTVRLFDPAALTLTSGGTACPLLYLLREPG